MNGPLYREHVPESFPLDKESQTGRVWVCKAGSDPCSRKDPCASCRGRRNRRKGQVKQRAAAKALMVPTRRYASQNAHEEGFGGTLRVEVKSGARMANPVGTRYLECEAQSEVSRPVGDLRPFAAVFMPDGIADGLLCVRLSNLHEVVEALYHQLFGEAA